MKYIAPAMQIEEAMASQMIAESLRIVSGGDTTVDGDKALTKEDAWDIWGEE